MRNATKGGFKNRNLKIDKPLAQTFLVKKVRYRNATLVTSPVKDTNESFSHAHDMGFGNFAEYIKESYSEKLPKGS